MEIVRCKIVKATVSPHLRTVESKRRSLNEEILVCVGPYEDARESVMEIVRCKIVEAKIAPQPTMLIRKMGNMKGSF